jgi:hypothetical protein
MRLNHGPTPVTRLVVSPGQMRGFYQCCLRALFLAIVLHLIDFPGGLLPGSQLHLFGVAEVVAEDCPGDPPPPPPPQDCGGAPCPTLPGTGGGGCDDNPDACAEGSTSPTWHSDVLKRESAPLLTESVLYSSVSSAVFQSTMATFPSLEERVGHPCPGDPPPPPPPPIPVCASCEAPGVAATVELPLVTVRMNPATGMVNVPTWFWAEGYQGQDLHALQSWGPPYEDTTITVRYFVKEYLWNYGDGGQISSRSLGQPYPQESDISNAYGWSSQTESAGVFHGALIIRWGVEYTVNGVAPAALPEVTRRYEFEYPVQQLQPVIRP